MRIPTDGLPVAPVHHEGGAHPMHRSGPDLDDEALAALVAQVRESAIRTTAAALDELSEALPDPIISMSLRAWPEDFPVDIAVLRRVPHEARADSVMYRQVLAELARALGWAVHLFDAKDVEAEAAVLLGDRADDVLHGPKARLGSPWTKDHRQALAATVLAAAEER